MTQPKTQTAVETGYELQQKVGQWHRNVFGEGSVRRVGKKVLEEASELHCVTSRMHEQREVEKEAADVLISLYAIAEISGFDLLKSAAKRFMEVSKRTNQKDRDRERGID